MSPFKLIFLLACTLFSAPLSHAFEDTIDGESNLHQIRALALEMDPIDTSDGESNLHQARAIALEMDALRAELNRQSQPAVMGRLFGITGGLVIGTTLFFSSEPHDPSLFVYPLLAGTFSGLIIDFAMTVGRSMGINRVIKKMFEVSGQLQPL